MLVITKKVANVTFFALTIIVTGFLFVMTSISAEAKEVSTKSSQQFLKCSGGEGTSQERRNRRKLRKAKAHLSSLLEERQNTLTNIAGLLDLALQTEKNPTVEQGLKAIQATTLEQDIETVQSVSLTRNIEADIASITSVLGSNSEFLQNVIPYFNQSQQEELSRLGIELEVHFGSLQDGSRKLAEEAREVKRLQQLVE